MPATIIISIALVAVVALVVRKLYTDKKKGKACASCGGSCSGCPSAGMCHPEQKK